MRPILPCLCLLLAAACAVPTFAQEAPPTTPPLTEQELREQFTRSMNYMLRRAKLARTLAAEHIVYLGEHADKPEMHLIEEASQVIAFDLVCADDTMKPEELDRIATESSYRIASQAGQSPIGEKLADIGRQQSVQERMTLLGDISTTVFMFQVGRRRGLFDSLITDFGADGFCNGMRSSMRDRYNALVTAGAGAGD